MDPAPAATSPFTTTSQGEISLQHYAHLQNTRPTHHHLLNQQHLARQQQRQQHLEQRRRRHPQHFPQAHKQVDYGLPDFADGPHAVPSTPVFDSHLPNLSRLDTAAVLSLVSDGSYTTHEVTPGGGPGYGRNEASPLTQIHLDVHQHPNHRSLTGPSHHHNIPHASQHEAPTPLSPATQSAPSTLGPYVPTALGTNIMSTPTQQIAQLHHEDDIFRSPNQASSVVGPASTDAVETRPHGQLVSRIVVDPPDLAAWRERLFNVDETIVLTNDQFETYFPHIDNVYSHRSTQRYKRKPFISHYWDCRMKGRPPGTPKSDDPAKKKRKRNARERDLCDVKIKITEYFPGAAIQLDDDEQHTLVGDGLVNQHPETNGDKFWTIQRVNGNGGNGKGDGVAGPHKHSLEKSDEIKKSTVQRYLTMQQKEARRAQKPLHRKSSGQAMQTVKKHNKDHDLKLYAACFCPFSQRVWIALEAKGMAYQYCETDPYKKSTQLLEANPRGLVPAIREGDWASGESSVILEYLEDRHNGLPLFPTDPRLKANCRFWIDHINVNIVPSFFALARAQDSGKQYECTERLQTDINALVQAADETGPYFLGTDMCLVDIHLAPFALRLSRLFRKQAKWLNPMPGTRWHQWVDALEHNPHVQATTSSMDLYTETFDMYTT